MKALLIICGIAFLAWCYWLLAKTIEYFRNSEIVQDFLNEKSYEDEDTQSDQQQ